MRVIIAGGRDFNDYEYLKLTCDKVLANQKNLEIVSGTAKGADQLGEKYAKDKNYPINRYPADWDKYGKSAGHKRNTLMAENAEALIAFWDGGSRGTKNMIDTATRLNLRVRIIKYTEEKI